MRRLLGRLVLLLILAGMGSFAYLEWTRPPAEQGQGQGRRAGRRGGGAGGDGPVPVLVAAARRADVPVTLEAVGTVQALNTVTVRSQVDGRLLELAFREGQDVARGDVIARIDPTIYQAQYDQAVAKKAQDEANLANARIDLQRYASLASTNFGSKQQADTQRALVAQLEAQVKSDQGAIDNARAYLEWTTIRAPIAGRTGLRLVDQGNLVRAADTTGIVTITQLQPISLVFNLAQQNLRALTAASAVGKVPVEALESDNKTVLDRGAIEVVDNQVDQTTGTVRVKATFPNERLQLWPGAFVNVRVKVDTLGDVVVVPTGAVQRGPSGPFVYLVVDGEKAVMKPVTVTRQDEEIAVIASGVAPPESVVTTGFARLTDGARVRIAEPDPPPGQAAPPAVRPSDGEARAPGGEGAPERRRRRPEGQGAGAGAAESERPPGERRRRRDQAAGEGAGSSPGAAPRPGPATTGSSP